ncbi:MAG: RNA methyltransferase [Bacteroidota bacterium]
MNIPAQLLQDIAAVPGFDEAAFIAAHNQPAPTAVRINPYKDIGLFGTDEVVPWCSNGRYLATRPVFTLDPAFHAGAYYVQEASSMFLEHMIKALLPQRSNLRVLDLCGAPGGKSTLIASLLGRESLLVANEVIRTRASILEENMVRWGYMNTWVTSNDPHDFGKLSGYFDVMVVDAPCSGSGLWRKDERAIGEWSEANVQLCSERQQRILADVWPALKPGGILIYATCSYSPQEDEEILDWLSAEYDAATLIVTVPAEWGIVQTTSATGMAGYRFFPHRIKGEGFFIAAVQKTGEEETFHNRQRFRSYHDKKIQQQAAHLLSRDDIAFVQAGKDTYNAILALHEPDLQLLQKAVYLRKTGLDIGTPSAKEWLPGHDMALSIDAAAGIPAITVTREQALRYLKREDMGIDDAPKGWLLVKYNGLSLGWIKSLGNRINNYLPKQWRIRMDID